MTDTPWRAFRVDPDDVLFFRDGRPSSLGSDHYLRSLFPPFPSTLYGAVRTRRLLDRGVPLGRLDEAAWPELLGPLAGELGPWGGFGSLRLRGPWLLRGDEILLPAPADLELLVDEAGEGRPRDGEPPSPRVEKVLRLRPRPAGETRWSHPLTLLEPCERAAGGWRPWASPPRPAPKASAGWYLRPAGVDRWLAGGLPEPADFVAASELWLDEVRTGVGLQEGERAAYEGQLYTFGFVRLRPGVALGFEVAESDLAPGGTLRLGGDARTVRLESGPPFPFSTPPAIPPGPFRLLFATPSLSASGAYPPGLAASSLAGHLSGVPCTLTGAALRRFTLAGGWDLARGFPKPLRRAIPAGSVYLLEASPGAAVADLHTTHLTDFPGEELARQGYGLALVGAGA